MTNHSFITTKQQAKALFNARRDVAFQQFMRNVLGVSPSHGQQFDRAAVEGFRHA